MIMHDYTATETLNYSNPGPCLSMKKSTISCPEKNGYILNLMNMIINTAACMHVFNYYCN